MGIGDRLRVRRDSHGNITLEKLEASFARNISRDSRISCQLRRFL